jgi:DNA-binding MarR family transcriptional regulator
MQAQRMMRTEKPRPASTPCLCNALRQASRAVSRLYDDDLREVGLRTTQYALLRIICEAGELRQADLSGLMALEETTLSRNLRAVVKSGWVAIQAGNDRRERRVAITPVGVAKLKDARPAWIKAQKRMKSLLKDELWHKLLAVLPDVARVAITA